MNTDRIWAGAGRVGPDHVIEAVGGDRIKPKSHPQGPDPTGVTVLNQCWELGSDIGTIATCGVGSSGRRVRPDPGGTVGGRREASSGPVRAAAPTIGVILAAIAD